MTRVQFDNGKIATLEVKTWSCPEDTAFADLLNRTTIRAPRGYNPDPELDYAANAIDDHGGRVIQYPPIGPGVIRDAAGNIIAVA